jgi:hypothetical protein
VLYLKSSPVVKQ